MVLFRTPRLRKHVILTMMSWALTYFVFDGYIRNIVNLDYDIYITFALMAGMELPAVGTFIEKMICFQA